MTTLETRLTDLSDELKRQLETGDIDCEELQRLLSLARKETQAPVSIQQEKRKKGIIAAPATKTFQRNDF